MRAQSIRGNSGILLGVGAGLAIVVLLVLQAMSSSGVFGTRNETATSTGNITGYTCIGSTTTISSQNASQIFVHTCSITRVVLDVRGCYEYSNGSELCAQGAPANSIADSYLNGTVIITYPDGYKVPARLHMVKGPV